jgi:hypothetical protein
MPAGTPPSRRSRQRLDRRALRGQRLGAASPTLMPKTGRDEQAEQHRPTPAASQRRRVTPRAQAVQARDALFSCRMRGQSTRGPMLPEHGRQQRQHDRALTTG